MLGNGGNRWLPLMTWLMVQPSLTIDGGENSSTIVESPKGQAYHGTRSPLLPPTEGMLQLVDSTAERWQHLQPCDHSTAVGRHGSRGGCAA